MRVALITNYWKNSDGGGVKNYVVNLAEALKEAGIDVKVLFREGDDVDHYKGDRNKILFSLSCLRALKRIKPDCIHAHGTWYCLLPGVIYKKLYGCKLVHTFHTEPVKPLSLPARLFFQKLLNACDWVTFVSFGLQKRIQEIDKLTFHRTAITYAGIKSKSVSDKEIRIFCQQFNINKGAIILLALGLTAHELKKEGLKILIRTVSELKKKYPNILLIATREGKYSDELRHFTKELELKEHVIFTGNIDNPFVPLKICTIYTHISLGEGLPISLLEAMSMGTPIVATNAGGIPEAIIDGVNGLLVDSDVEKIAENIDFLIQNKEIAEKLGRCAKKTVNDEFTWRKTSIYFIRLFSSDI